MAVALLLAFEGRDRSFYGDEWGYANRLATQPLGEALIDPPSRKYLIPIPLLVYGGLFEVFGLDSFTPFRLVAIVAHLTVCLLLFALARRRVGGWGAVAAVAPLLVLSAAGSEVLLSSARLPMLIALAFGLLAMLGLDRGDRRGDVIACAGLIVSVLSHPVALAFIVGAGVRLVLGERGIARSWVYLAPALVIIAFGVLSDTDPYRAGVLDAAEFVLTYAGGTIAAIGAWVSASGRPDAAAMAVLGAIALLAVAVALWRRSTRVSPSLWAALAMPLVLWVITAIAPGDARGVLLDRHLYPSALLVLFAACEWARDRRPGGRVVVALAVATPIVLALHVASLIGHDPGAAERTRIVRTSLGVLELGRSVISEGFRPAQSPVLQEVVPCRRESSAEPGRSRPCLAHEARGLRFPAEEYWEMADRFGTPAYTSGQIAAASQRARAAADGLLVDGLGIALEPAGAELGAGRCRRVGGSEAQPTIVKLPPSRRVAVEADDGAALQAGLARFSRERWVRLEKEGSGRYAIAVPYGPGDAGDPVWRARIEARSPLEVCRTDRSEP